MQKSARPFTSTSIRRTKQRWRRLRSTLQIGADGELVVALQRTLNARIKPSPGIGTDGDFGPETEGAVKKFQTQEKLKPTGIVDAETWKALGPLVMEEEPAPEPAVVNAEQNQEIAARYARRPAVRHVQSLGDRRRRHRASSWPAIMRMRNASRPAPRRS